MSHVFEGIPEFPEFTDVIYNRDSATAMSERDKLLSGGAPPPYQGPPPPYQHPGPQYPPPHPQVQSHSAVRHVVITEHRPVAVVTLPPPSDQMGFAILALICFFPLGIAAILMAQKVRDSVARGNISEAYRHAYAVRVLSRLAYSIGVITIISIILCVVLPITLRAGDDY